MQAAIRKLRKLPQPSREDRPLDVMAAIKRQQEAHDNIDRLVKRREAALSRVSASGHNTHMWIAAWDAVYETERELDEARETLWNGIGDEVAARWRWHREIILDAVEEALKPKSPRRRSAKR